MCLILDFRNFDGKVYQNTYPQFLDLSDREAMETAGQPTFAEYLFVFSTISTI